MTAIDEPLDRKQQVLAAAIQLFIKKGVQNTSMNEIILASGLSKGGVYHHFDSKDNLILGVVDFYLDTQRLSLQQALSQEGTTRQRLETLLRTNMASELFYQQGLWPMRMYLDMILVAIDKPEVLHRIRQGYEELMGLFYPIIDKGIQQGEFKPGTDARQIAITLAAIFDGLQLLQPLEQGGFDWVAMGLEATNHVLNGISAHPAP